MTEVCCFGCRKSDIERCSQRKSATKVSRNDLTMARTGTNKQREISDPEKSYSKLSYPDQMICYNYFQWGEMDGSEGWDPKKIVESFVLATKGPLIQQVNPL